MGYLVTISCPVYEDDFDSTYRFFHTREEAMRYKAMVREETDNDGFVIVEVYEVKRIA